MQYLAIRYAHRLAEAASKASVGDLYDNACAETIIGLFKTEVIYRRGPWRNVGDVEFATLEWIDWFNRRRLFGPLGYVPPIEFEQAYDRAQETPAAVAGLVQLGLSGSRGGSAS